jgi:hypothetical protein
VAVLRACELRCPGGLRGGAGAARGAAWLTRISCASGPRARRAAGGAGGACCTSGSSRSVRGSGRYKAPSLEALPAASPPPRRRRRRRLAAAAARRLAESRKPLVCKKILQHNTNGPGYAQQAAPGFSQSSDSSPPPRPPQRPPTRLSAARSSHGAARCTQHSSGRNPPQDHPPIFSKVRDASAEPTRRPQDTAVAQSRCRSHGRRSSGTQTIWSQLPLDFYMSGVSGEERSGVEWSGVERSGVEWRKNERKRPAGRSFYSKSGSIEGVHISWYLVSWAYEK